VCKPVGVFVETTGGVAFFGEEEDSSASNRLRLGGEGEGPLATAATAFGDAGNAVAVACSAFVSACGPAVSSVSAPSSAVVSAPAALPSSATGLCGDLPGAARPASALGEPAMPPKNPTRLPLSFASALAGGDVGPSAFTPDAGVCDTAGGPEGDAAGVFAEVFGKDT
jgi:hypothetical protein